MLKRIHPEHNLSRKRPGDLKIVADKKGRIVYERDRIGKKVKK